EWWATRGRAASTKVNRATNRRSVRVMSTSLDIAYYALMQRVALAGITAILFGFTGKAEVSFTPEPVTDHDKAEIQRLCTEYQRALFACDGDGYANLFATPGGYFASAPRGEIRERKALIEMVIGYDRCEPGKPSTEPAPPTAAAGAAAPRFPTPV